MVSTLLSAWRKARVVSDAPSPAHANQMYSPSSSLAFLLASLLLASSSRSWCRQAETLTCQCCGLRAAGARYDHALRRRSQGRATPIHSARSMRSHSVDQRRDAPHHSGVRRP